MLRMLTLLLLLATSSAWSEDRITHQHIVDLLAKEKKFFQEKNASGLSSIFTDDMTYIDKNKKTSGKEEYLANGYVHFMNAEKLLYKPEIVSEQISKDGCCAEVVIKSVTKVLFVVAELKRVISSNSTHKVIVVLDGGVAKFRSGEYLSGEVQVMGQ